MIVRDDMDALLQVLRCPLSAPFTVSCVTLFPFTSTWLHEKSTAAPVSRQSLAQHAPALPPMLRCVPFEALAPSNCAANLLTRRCCPLTFGSRWCATRSAPRCSRWSWTWAGAPRRASWASPAASSCATARCVLPSRGILGGARTPGHKVLLGVPATLRAPTACATVCFNSLASCPALLSCWRCCQPLSPPPYIAHFLQITKEDLAHAEEALGDFGGDNRAGVEGTLHRISGGHLGSKGGLFCEEERPAEMGASQQAALNRRAKVLARAALPALPPCSHPQPQGQHRRADVPRGARGDGPYRHDSRRAGRCVGAQAAHTHRRESSCPASSWRLALACWLEAAVTAPPCPTPQPCSTGEPGAQLRAVPGQAGRGQDDGHSRDGTRALR